MNNKCRNCGGVGQNCTCLLFAQSQDGTRDILREGGVILTVTAESDKITWTLKELIDGSEFARMDDKQTFEKYLTRIFSNLSAEDLR